MISLRIPEEMEKRLRSLARLEGKSRSEIIKQSIAEYLTRREGALTPYELGKDLFGAASSDREDLSVNRKQYLKESLQAKHEKRTGTKKSDGTMTWRPVAGIVFFISSMP